MLLTRKIKEKLSSFITHTNSDEALFYMYLDSNSDILTFRLPDTYYMRTLQLDTSAPPGSVTYWVMFSFYKVDDPNGWN